MVVKISPSELLKFPFHVSLVFIVLLFIVNTCGRLAALFLHAALLSLHLCYSRGVVSSWRENEVVVSDDMADE